MVELIHFITKLHSNLKLNFIVQNSPYILRNNKRFDYNTLPNNFLDTDLLNETIHIIESQTLEQTDIDQIYEDICNIYYTELNDKVRFKCILNKNKKR